MSSVPEYIRSAARRGLELLDYAGDGLRPATIREARRMAAGTATPDKIRRMAAWFARHRVDLDSPDALAYARGDSDRPTAGQVAWLLWGGSLGKDKERARIWAEGERDRLDAAELNKNRKEPDMNTQKATASPDLVTGLRQTLANVLVFYAAAHRAHWDVMGADFREYHGLFEDIYSDVYGSIDPFAENIRKMKAFPLTLPEMVAISAVKDDSATTDARTLASDLLGKNITIIEILKALFDIATAANEQGIANFVAERIDAHEKWDWQLSSSLA